MDGQERQEIREYLNEKIERENYISTNKMLFERELKNGLGEQMMYELKNPPKENKSLARRIKIARFFERLFAVL